MKLNKRYFRSIKNNLSFYVSATVLTVTTLFLFYMMNIAGKSIWEYGDEFFRTQNIEDANFTTYLPIPDEEMEELEKEYPRLQFLVDTGNERIQKEMYLAHFPAKAADGQNQVRAGDNNDFRNGIAVLEGPHRTDDHRLTF